MNRFWRVILIASILLNLSIVYVAIKALEYRAHINEFLDKYTHVVNEFSRRDRYQDENRALRSDTIVPARIVLFGSQIIENWPLNEYPAGFEIINRGVTAQRVSGFLLRYRPDVIELAPEAIVIEISSYNLRPQYSVKEVSDYMAGMIELALFHGIRPIPATMIPPCRDSVDLGGYHIIDSIALYNEWLEKYCTARNIQFVGFNKAVVDGDGFLRVEYAASSIDLNNDGYEQLRKALLEILHQQPGI
ncbi:MAG: GDSL-type esterase/lipase family protein [Candidatus Zixiibacteriota bacterium]